MMKVLWWFLFADLVLCLSAFIFYCVVDMIRPELYDGSV
jgi:hypothetical protein